MHGAARSARLANETLDVFSIAILHTAVRNYIIFISIATDVTDLDFYRRRLHETHS